MKFAVFMLNISMATPGLGVLPFKTRSLIMSFLIQLPAAYPRLCFSPNVYVYLCFCVWVGT